MASEGFLTSIYAGDDVTRPTFFELVAQEQLMDALRPAVQFVVGVFADRAPPRVLPFIARWDTIYTIFQLLLDWYHLRLHGASFAEHFYGLQRQEGMPQRKPTPLEKIELERRRQEAPNLTLWQRLASLAVVVLLPWLRSRCERSFREAEGMTAQVPGRAVRPRWLGLYPWAHAMGHTVAILYRVLYLLGQTDVWSPVLHVLGLRLVRHFPEPPAAAGAGGIKGRLLRVWDTATTAGSLSLWGAIYLMQFLQWWYQREHLLQPYQPKKVPPPPPPRPPYRDTALPPQRQGSADHDDGPRLVLLPLDRTICPLCHRVRRNPAMSCSGYVFCYPCLLLHVQRFGHCPVTGLGMTPEQVRRIRDDSDDMTGF